MAKVTSEELLAVNTQFILQYLDRVVEVYAQKVEGFDPEDIHDTQKAHIYALVNIIAAIMASIKMTSEPYANFLKSLDGLSE